MSETQQQPPPPVPVRSFQPSFAAGELTPPLRWREDLAKGRAGAASIENMVVLATGAVARRAGTQFVALGKDVLALQRLIPFQFNTEQQYVIEAGNAYMRFYTQGAPLTNPDGSTYEIATPYQLADLALLRYVQSADVLTIVHPSYQPMNLERYGLLDWRLQAINVGERVSPPGGVAVTATVEGPSGTPAPAQHAYTYAVTATINATHGESSVSAAVTCNNFDLGYNNQYGTVNIISWSAVAGADFYTVYRQFQGSWARIGATVGLSFSDTDYTPDTTTGPPQFTNPFTDNNWPGTVGYFQERQVFAGSAANPETMWMSRAGSYTNFDVSTPVKDDDAITYTLAARQVNQIRHLVPLTDLMVFTGGGGWRVTGSNGAVTPSNFDAAPQSFVGSSDVEPVVVGNRILFVEAKGSSIREIAFQFVQNQYVSEDRGVFAQHLFRGHTIVSWAWAESPDKVLWAVRDDGVLLSLTYLIEQDIYAWAHHTTAGLFRAVTVISEKTYQGQVEDVAYFVVWRTIGGSLVSMIERMQTRQLGAADNDVTLAWHVDAGLQYAGAPVTHVAGLAHLEGQTVAVLADGAPAVAVVSGGAIDLPVQASRVTAGLPFASSVTTLPLDSPQPQAEPLAGRKKRLYRIRVPVQNAAGLVVSVDGGATTPLMVADGGWTSGGVQEPSPPDVVEAAVAAPGMVTDIVEAWMPEGWSRGGQVTIAANGPLPATVLGIAGEWQVGS